MSFNNLPASSASATQAEIDYLEAYNTAAKLIDARRADAMSAPLWTPLVIKGVCKVDIDAQNAIRLEELQKVCALINIYNI